MTTLRDTEGTFPLRGKTLVSGKRPQPKPTRPGSGVGQGQIGSELRTFGNDTQRHNETRETSKQIGSVTLGCLAMEIT